MFQTILLFYCLFQRAGEREREAPGLVGLSLKFAMNLTLKMYVFYIHGNRFFVRTRTEATTTLAGKHFKHFSGGWLAWPILPYYE